MKLSILITVYNQIEVVKENIEEILKYQGDDIEVVISDDCSKDDIYGLVKSYEDRRIVYTRTSENKGLDNNTINGIQHCTGDFILLLRSRDFILGEAISKVIKTIDRFPNASYFLFSAYDENMNIRMLLEERVYHRYDEAQQANDFLLPHPSGQFYKRELLDIDKYRKYVDDYFSENNGCILYTLIRIDLAIKGDFITSPELVWIYYDTLKRTDKSQQPVRNKLNFYHPKYHSLRYRCIWKFICNEIPKEYRYHYLKFTMLDFGRTLTVHFLYANNNKAINEHYSSKKVFFNPYYWLNKYEHMTLDMLKNIDADEQEKLKKDLYDNHNKLKRKIFEMYIQIYKEKIKNIFKFFDI